jgi:hypothetical protein
MDNERSMERSSRSFLLECWACGDTLETSALARDNHTNLRRTLVGIKDVYGGLLASLYAAGVLQRKASSQLSSAQISSSVSMLNIRLSPGIVLTL